MFVIISSFSDIEWKPSALVITRTQIEYPCFINISIKDLFDHHQCQHHQVDHLAATMNLKTSEIWQLRSKMLKIPAYESFFFLKMNHNLWIIFITNNLYDHVIKRTMVTWWIKVSSHLPSMCFICSAEIDYIWEYKWIGVNVVGACHNHTKMKYSKNDVIL